MALETDLAHRLNWAPVSKSVAVPIGESALEEACVALLYSSIVKDVSIEHWEAFKKWVPYLAPHPLSLCLARFLSEAPDGCCSAVVDILKLILEAKDNIFPENKTKEQILDTLGEKLCEAYICSSWKKHKRFQETILLLAASGGKDWRQKHELRFVNTAFVAFKSLPSELSSASISAASFTIRLCCTLYNVSLGGKLGEAIIWDSFPLYDEKIADPESTKENDDENSEGLTRGAAMRPSDEVFRAVLQDIVCMQQLPRCVHTCLGHYYPSFAI